MTYKTRVKDMTDEEYHKQGNLEEHFFSSSQIKQAKNNIKVFHRQAVEGIAKTFSPTTLDAFTVGHYFHSYFLEPDTLDKYAKYDGAKRGKVWSDFKEANEGKRILTTSMQDSAQTLIDGVNSSIPCMNMLNKKFGTEESFFSEIEGLRVKCRFDILHELKDHAIGGDLKSCSEADLDNEEILRKIISNYGYALSYALYRDIYEKVTGKPMKGWYWIFASKSTPFAKLVWASEDYYKLGRMQYLEGIAKIKELKADGWEYKDKEITLTPKAWEMSEIAKHVSVEDEL